MKPVYRALALVLGWSSAFFGQSPAAAGPGDAVKQAEKMLSRGDPEGVIRTLTPWAEEHPDDAGARRALGLAYYQQNNFASAIPHLAAALKLEDRDSPRWRQAVEALAMAYYFSNRLPEALPLLEKAVTWNVRDTYFQYALAMAYVYAGDRDNARRVFARLFRIPPDSPQALVLTAHFLVREKFLAEGEELIRKAQEQLPGLADTNYRLGLIALANGALPEARQYFEKELAANPMHHMAWHYLGEVYNRLGKWDEAAAALQRSIWLNVRATESYILIANVYTQQGKHAEAEHALKRALELAPQNYEAHFLLARVYHKTGRAELARRELAIANKLRGESEGR